MKLESRQSHGGWDHRKGWQQIRMEMDGKSRALREESEQNRPRTYCRINNDSDVVFSIAWKETALLSKSARQERSSMLSFAESRLLCLDFDRTIAKDRARMGKVKILSFQVCISCRLYVLSGAYVGHIQGRPTESDPCVRGQVIELRMWPHPQQLLRHVETWYIWNFSASVFGTRRKLSPIWHSFAGWSEPFGSEQERWKLGMKQPVIRRHGKMMEGKIVGAIWCILDKCSRSTTILNDCNLIVTIEMALTHFDFRVSWVCAVHLCDIRSLRLLAVLMWRAKPCSSHSVKTMGLWSPPQLIIQTPHPRPQFWHVFHKERERVWKNMKDTKEYARYERPWACLGHVLIQDRYPRHHQPEKVRGSRPLNHKKCKQKWAAHGYTMLHHFLLFHSMPGMTGWHRSCLSEE